jgi:hypothetical protein
MSHPDMKRATNAWSPMTDSNRSYIWIGVAAAVAVFAAATWFTRGDSPGETLSTGRAATQTEHAPQRDLDTGKDALDSEIRIAEHGRLSLDAQSLPSEGPLTLVLDLPDEARGDGLRTIRIVSTDGRRVETTTSSLEGPGTGVQLDIESGFLSRGLYMIEIDTVDNTPLRIRRYVLELK